VSNVQLSEQKGKKLVKDWLADVNDALKREKKYRLIAQDCVDLYECKQPEQVPFAILYSNTETLAPAVYNARPIPIVQRRYKDADPLGKAVSEVSTRLLKFLIDNDSKDYDNFDELMQPAVLDGLITNRGLTRFRYMGETGNRPECVYGEAVRWDKFFHGYARTWKKVPWIGFEWDMSKDELKTNFPDATFMDLRRMVNTDEDDSENRAEDREELTGVRTYKVYEIWDKLTGKVLFISPACEQPLKYVDDPLQLSGFFPVPKPLNFMRKVTTLVPTPLYQHYRQQAKELNDITVRLKAIVKAIRYRGAYNSAVEGIAKMLEADDNELVPVENVQSMGDGTGMDKLLWTVPIQELANTAQILMQQREAIKQVIYEITGISDILRGASVASETATAQNIKNQWGTLRLKKAQKEVQRYCRDALAIILEIAAATFDIPTMRQMTGLPYLTNDEKAAIQGKIQEMQAQAAMLAQQQAATNGPMVAPQPAGPIGAPVPPSPGMPPVQQPTPMPPPMPVPQQPQIPPEVQQLLQEPSWEDIQQVMQNDVSMHYKTDIETNSTIDAEAAQDKQDISELLNAVSQFLNGVAPLVQEGVLPIEVAKSMLLVVSRRFNFGSQLEDALNAMQAPQPKADPAADAKAEAEKAKAAAATAKSQSDMQQTQLDAQVAQQKFASEKEMIVLKAEVAKMELEIKKQELAIQQAGLRSKMEFQTAAHNQKMEALKAKPTKETVNA
jgi:hypothetical protein